ncbi:hypothetical protein CEE37_07615 [candidate division LCP-89 bacterium B3_LCP]|uniref:Uncharacterized protein n=1 Tax=candidate division LCP-89 bacterium B3_LCP TaxID=2012998 RepID=A0A532V0T2_UNCL8|nr:MAG: hypothetical protein CEE37_07615 [candidate division LCP-89 bacterium B3_LCP]
MVSVHEISFSLPYPNIDRQYFTCEFLRELLSLRMMADQSKKITTIPLLLAGCFCLLCAVLLWKNIALHFAQIEEILPSLHISNLIAGKTIFFIFIVFCLGLAIFILTKIPWRQLLPDTGNKVRLVLSLAAFGITFMPLFWLRFGAAAWLLTVLHAISLLLGLVGIIALSSWLAQRFQFSTHTLKGSWLYSNPWFPAAFLLGLSLYFSHHCFANIPHIEDSIAQLLQARIFATGQITSEPFLPKEFFFFGFMLDFDRWFSQYPPGHPLILTLGVLIKMPYLINPLLGVLSVILCYFLLKWSIGQKEASWGAWAMCLSPFVIFMSSEFMNHSTTLVTSLLGWVALYKITDRRKIWSIIAGLAFGYCAATRPLEGVILALIGGCYVLSTDGKLQFKSILNAVPYTLGFLAAVSLYFIHNSLTTGHPLTTGYQLSWGGTGVGLGEVNWGPPHTLSYGIINTFMSIAGFNVYLFEIPLPALLGIFIWAAWGKRLTNWDKVMLAVLILIPIGYLFYYFHDFCFGPRYYYVLVPQVLYFTIKGICIIYNRMVQGLAIPHQKVRSGLIWAGIILLVLQFSIAIPYRSSVYADNYWGTDDGPMREARRLDLKNAVVFIENQPWEVLQTKLHHLGYNMGDAHKLMFLVTLEGLNKVLTEMGYRGEDSWEAEVNLIELNKRIYIWNDRHIDAGNPPIDPWAVEGNYTYFSNGVLHQDPTDRNPEVILVRDLGDHNNKLLEQFPGRKTYRYAYDPEVGRFRILPLRL